MAKAYERWSERTGSKAADNADAGVRSFDIIEATSEADCYTADLILTDLANPTGKVPIFNEIDPRNTRRKARSFSVSSAGFNLLRLTVAYTIPVNGDSHADTEENPLTAPTRWSWSRSKTTETVDRDKDGNAIVNSNRQPFANGAQRTYTQRTLEARRYESVYPASIAETFEDSVNSTSFSGPAGISFATGTVKCNIITVAGEYTDESPYVEVVYQFEIRPDGWKTRQLDEGTMGRDSAGLFLPLFNTNGDKVTSPVLLNGGGNPVDFDSYKLGDQTGNIAGSSDPNPPTGATIEVAPGSEATFLRYSLYPERDLNSLGL